MPYVALDPAAAQAAPAVTFGAPEAAGAHPMGKSLAEMRTRLRVELGNRADLAAATIDEWINDAYLDFYASLDLPDSKRSFPVTLTAGQALYLLPATMDTVRGVAATDTSSTDTGAALRVSDEFLYRKRPIQSGPPEEWFRYQNMLVLWPTPDAADVLSVDGRIKPAKLTADTHYPILEDKLHEALFKGAKYRGWEALQNDTKAATTMNEMTRLIGRKKDRDDGDKEDAYPSLRVVTSRDDIMSVRNRPRWVEPGDDWP